MAIHNWQWPKKDIKVSGHKAFPETKRGVDNAELWFWNTTNCLCQNKSFVDSNFTLRAGVGLKQGF